MEGLNDKPVPVELFGKFVKLLPMDIDRDIEYLFEITCGKPFKFKNKSFESYDSVELLWKYMFLGPFISSEEMKSFYRDFISRPATLVFTIFELSSNLPVGSLAYTYNSPIDKKVEIGVVWVSPAVQRTGCCTEAVFLLLEHAFNHGWRRVEWKCCNKNYRSVAFAEKLGFQLEVHGVDWCVYRTDRADIFWFALMRENWKKIWKEKVISFISE